MVPLVERARLVDAELRLAEDDFDDGNFNGWTITDDPLTIRIGKKDMYIDLGRGENYCGGKRK